MVKYRSLIWPMLVSAASQAMARSVYCHSDVQLYPPTITESACYNSAYKQLVVFGDSWTENGFGPLTSNMYQTSNYLGRRTNGPTWAEYLAKLLGSDLHDFAYSGATADNEIINRTIPDVHQQIDEFQDMPLELDPRTTLYSIWIGINDIHDTFVKISNKGLQNFAIASILNSIYDELEKLYSLSARHFMLVGLPSIDRLPVLGNYSEIEMSDLRSLITLYNNGLQLVLEKFSNSHSSNQEPTPVDAFFFDSRVLFEKLENSPKSYGLSEVKLTCIDHGLCDGYIWYDTWHPTTTVQSIIAQAIDQEIVTYLSTNN